VTHPSKAKGNTFEREIVKQAENWGHEAKRAWGSDGRALGLQTDVDVIVNDDLPIQCKRVARMAKYLKPEAGAAVVAVREDRNMTTFFVVPEKMFWMMYESWRHSLP